MMSTEHLSLGLEKTRQVAWYMRQLLGQKGDTVPPLPDWPLEILREIHFMVRVVKQAIGNQSKKSTNFFTNMLNN